MLRLKNYVSVISINRFKHNLIDLTKDNYDVKRKNFAKLQQNHVDYFVSILDKNRVITDVNDIEKYNVDWMNLCRGSSGLVLKPKDTEEVSGILQYCKQHKLAVCPQGGNTAITGGAVPVFDEIVLSTELMNQIIHIDENSGVAVCQSGCILENLNEHLARHDLTVPLDLGAKGSCMIGGNVSSNAGGLRLLRYGSLHGSVLGIEAVLADGTIIDCLNTLKKDNTGYHLKHLFIGSEGTLGVVTKVALSCPQKSHGIHVIFLGLESYDKALAVFKKARRDLGEILSAFEVMDWESLDFAKEKLGITSPIGEFPYYLLIETSGSNREHDGLKLDKFFEDILNERLILNGTVANEPGKINAIWDVRERIPQGFKSCKSIFCYDFSLPLHRYFDIVDEMRKYLGNKAVRVFGFGHMGDGNLHLQIELPEYTKQSKDFIEPYVFEKIKENNGSISAEHGMGFLKANYLNLTRSENVVGLMKNLKNTLDPDGILNPYKVLPWDV